mmetsp:Transcript_65897/g.158926  ORF Transcript_65897/g.158926 Transcript_65897/m.158926 type:complete len:201 (-) Transcript_65897:253-855(-)
MHAFFFTPGPPNLHEVTQTSARVACSRETHGHTRAHAGGRAAVGRGKGAAERAAMGEAGVEGRRGGGEGPWGRRGGPCHLGLSRQFLPAHERKQGNIHVSSQMTQGVCLCGLPRRYGSRGQWGLWKGQPKPALRNRTTAFSTSVSCIHRSLLLCTPRRSRTELSWPTSLPQCSTRPHCSVRRLLAWVPPPVLWPAPLLCA